MSALSTFIAFERPKGLAIELRLPDTTGICLDEETKGIKWKLLLVIYFFKAEIKAHNSTPSCSEFFGGFLRENGYGSHWDRGGWSLRNATHDFLDH